MKLLLIYGAGRLIYGFIGQANLWNLFAEFIDFAVFLFIGNALLNISNAEIRGVSLGLLFVSSGVLTRYLVRLIPELKKPSDQRVRVSVGIIDVSWLSIMGATLAIIVFTQTVPPFSTTVSDGLKPDYYKEMAGACTFFLGKTIDSIFLLGGILAACMSIIWAGEIWRKDRSPGNRDYLATTISSIKMVWAYFVCIGSALLYIGIPLYMKLFELSDKLK